MYCIEVEDFCVAGVNEIADELFFPVDGIVAVVGTEDNKAVGALEMLDEAGGAAVKVLIVVAPGTVDRPHMPQ